MASLRARLRRASLHIAASCAAVLMLPAVASSSLDAPLALELPAQPLGESLRSLAKQANLQILFEANLVAGRAGREIRARVSARDALGTLLLDTALEAYEQTPGVVVIRRRPDERTSPGSRAIDPERAQKPTPEVRQ